MWGRSRFTWELRSWWLTWEPAYLLCLHVVLLLWNLLTLLFPYSICLSSVIFILSLSQSSLTHGLCRSMDCPNLQIVICHSSLYRSPALPVWLQIHPEPSNFIIYCCTADPHKLYILLLADLAGSWTFQLYIVLLPWLCYPAPPLFCHILAEHQICRSGFVLPFKFILFYCFASDSSWTI